MKRIALFVLVCLVAAGVGAQTLKLGTLGGTAFYKPLVVRVIKEAGYDSEIVLYNSLPELIAAFSKGDIEGGFFLAQPIIEQINGAVMVPVRLNQSNFVAVTTDPSIKVNNPGDLRKYSVGIVKDNTAHTAITRGVNTVVTENDQQQMAQLKEGKFQVAIVVDKLVPVMAGIVGLEKFYISERPLLMTPTFLALSGAKAAYKEKIEAVLKKWQDNGSWEAEMKKLDEAQAPG